MFGKEVAIADIVSSSNSCKESCGIVSYKRTQAQMKKKPQSDSEREAIGACEKLIGSPAFKLFKQHEKKNAGNVKSRDTRRAIVDKDGGAFSTCAIKD